MHLPPRLRTVLTVLARIVARKASRKMRCTRADLRALLAHRKVGRVCAIRQLIRLFRHHRTHLSVLLRKESPQTCAVGAPLRSVGVVQSKRPGRH